MTLLPSPDRVIAWPYLTSVARKRAAYAIESYFRQALWDAKLVCGDRLYPVLQRLTFTVFKPESFAGRRVDTALQFLHRQNYRPITCFPLTLTRHMLNEMWRYQWNAATIDKMEVGIRLNCGRPTQLVFWYDDSDSPELPASVRLKQLKGASTPRLRAPDTLREALGAPNRMITFIHTPDEPADILRELGIFFDRAVRRSVIERVVAALDDDGTQPCTRVLTELETATPRTDFDPMAAWQRVIDRAYGTAAHDQLAAQFAQFRATGSVDWETFLPLALAASAEEWDILSIGTAGIDYDLEGEEQVINFGAADIEAWRSGEAELLERV